MGSVASLCQEVALQTLDIWGLSERLVTGEPVAEALNTWDDESLKDMAVTFGVISNGKLQLLEDESEGIEQALSTGQGHAALREVASQWEPIAEPLRMLQPAVLRILAQPPLKVEPCLSLGLLATIGIMPAIPSGAGMLQGLARTVKSASSEAAVVIWEVAGLIANGDEADIHAVEKCIRADSHLNQCLDKAVGWVKIKYGDGNELSSPAGLIPIIAEMISTVLASETNIPRLENS